MVLAVPHPPAAGALAAPIQVVIIDLALAGAVAMRHWVRWFGGLGQTIAFDAARRLIWERHSRAVVDLGEVSAYKAATPAPFATTPDQVAAPQAGRN